MDKLEALYIKMLEHNNEDPRRCHHLIKVHSLARLLGLMEGLSPRQQLILEAAAYVHDIGIRPGEAKYGAGKCTGKIQEQEGPAVAEAMLQELGFDAELVKRVCYLVGHHHTYNNIEGSDYQLLVEADFLVNLYEDGVAKEKVAIAVERIFKSKSGIQLAKTMYGI